MVQNNGTYTHTEPRGSTDNTPMPRIEPIGQDEPMGPKIPGVEPMGGSSFISRHGLRKLVV